MTIRLLNIFVCVCDTGNMTTAAEKMYMTQPSVSQAIMELERHYDVKLFERLGKRLYITAAGKKLLSYARHMINLQEEMEKEMQDIKMSGGILRIGASVTVGTCILGKMIGKFYKIKPNVKIETVVDNTKVIEEMLLTDKIDIGLVEGMVHSQNLITQPFMKDELVLICGLQHPWKNQSYIDASELHGAGFIVREEGSGTRELFESVLASKGIQWYPTWVCNNAETIKNAVAAGMGISVISKMAVEDEVHSGKLSMIKIKDLCFERKFNMTYHKNKFISDTMQSLIDLCKE
jgi:DNA-binding transcriptional LysR family regulator